MAFHSGFSERRYRKNEPHLIKKMRFDVMIDLNMETGAGSNVVRITAPGRKIALKLNRDRCSLPRDAFQMNLRIVICRCVLDDAKSQSGTSGLLGVALIYPVKPFKDPIPMLFGNTNSGILYRKSLVFNNYLYASTGNIIFNGIITKIIYNFVEKSAYTRHTEAGTGH